MPVQDLFNSKPRFCAGFFLWGGARRIYQNAITSRVLTLRLSSQATQCKSLLESRFVDRLWRFEPAYPPERKTSADGEGSSFVGPGGFEPPTSAMSRPIGRAKRREDL